EQLAAHGPSPDGNAAGGHGLRVHQRVRHPETFRDLLASAVEPDRSGTELPPDHGPAGADVSGDDLLFRRQQLRTRAGVEMAERGLRLRLHVRLHVSGLRPLRATQCDRPAGPGHRTYGGSQPGYAELRRRRRTPRRGAARRGSRDQRHHQTAQRHLAVRCQPTRVPEVAGWRTLHQRWWLAPIAILVVAAAIIIRIITTPLEVNANVNDGDQAVPRTATIDLRFNQDMKADSVQQAFSISPAVLVGFKTVSAREFQFRPKMAPNTSYRVTVKDAKNTSGRGVSSSFRFKTEPAPSIAAVKVNNEKVTDGQQSLKPAGNVQIGFSQPMDGGKTPITLNGKPFDSKKVSWSGDGKTATLDFKLGHSHPYQ